MIYGNIPWYHLCSEMVYLVLAHEMGHVEKRHTVDKVFSFNKFPNVDKALGPEMKSTGESILFIDSLKDDAFYELYGRRKMYLSK